MNTHRLRVEIQGAVQGVGFRPFIYRLAAEMALPGWISNDTRGVVLEVEGMPPLLERFLERITAEKPPHALIQSLQSTWLEPAGYAAFEIRHSTVQGDKTVLVLPDLATCAACLAELYEPANRRYHYPFTNCTNCGPRFSIIEALPYDRPNTTMQHFTMCPACQHEYDHPPDRRFHAQPNACPRCGPHLRLVDPADPAAPLSHTSDAALHTVVAALRSGQIVALKGLGGFHLLVDAGNAEAVARLRERKPRRDKPFALMVPTLQHAHALCHLVPAEQALLTSAAAPIVLLRRQPAPAIAGNVAPGVDTLGIMLPYTPLHHLLLHEFDAPLVATSGNLSDEPICTDEHEAVQRLGHIADLFLVHNRPITRHVDDSVVWVVQGETQVLRRARGYAPLPVALPHRLPPLLAVGAHLKNSIALSSGQQVFLSQHIGDLESAEALAAFERVIHDMLRLYELAPRAIAHDQHPDYLSTRWAHAAPSSHLAHLDPAPALIAVQHHHAHLAACLAENGSDTPALGITWDGSGYGSDGTVWGGEFLLGNAAGYQRVAHLRPFRLPGGSAAIREPRRVAFALLWELYGSAALEQDDLLALQAVPPAERRLLAQMLTRGVNTPTTSSAGRLFDGVAALLGLHPRVSFEGQAAIALEAIADPYEQAAYPLDLIAGTGGQAESAAASHILDWRTMTEAVLADLRKRVKHSIIAAKFHNGLVQAMCDVARMVGHPRVALTGGCFQNRLLTERASQQLSQAGFTVLCHRQVPPNDGGIALGQILVADAHYRET